MCICVYVWMKSYRDFVKPLETPELHKHWQSWHSLKQGLHVGLRWAPFSCDWPLWLLSELNDHLAVSRYLRQQHRSFLKYIWHGNFTFHHTSNSYIMQLYRINRKLVGVWHSWHMNACMHAYIHTHTSRSLVLQALKLDVQYQFTLSGELISTVSE